jgi:hypothetical protein
VVVVVVMVVEAVVVMVEIAIDRISILDYKKTAFLKCGFLFSKDWIFFMHRCKGLQ